MAKRATIKTPQLDDLRPAKYNPRDITPEGLKALQASMGEFGDLSGITWNQRSGNLVTGHQRLRGLRELHGDALKMRRGVITTPDGVSFKVRVVDWPRKKERMANVVANSHLIGGYFTEDVEPLVDQLLGTDLATELLLDAMLVDLGFDRTAGDDVDEDDVPEPPAKAITKPGDVWTMGKHRVACISSSDAEGVTALMAGAEVDFMFTSPPYNVGVEYGDHDDNTTPWPEYREFLSAVLDAWLPHLRDGRLLGWNIGVSPKTHHAKQHLLIEDTDGMAFFRQMVWKKTGVPVPSWYHTTNNLVARNFSPNYVHELVLLFTKGKPTRGRAVAGDAMCEHDVFTISQQMSTVDLPEGPTRTGAKSNLDRRSKKAHPAPFPVRLPAMFMAHLCDVGEVVADPFMGAGSTLMAAEQTERPAIGCELEPRYCDVIVQRWENMTGGKATRKKL